MHSYIRPSTHVALRLPSGIFKIVEITPNTTINIGKFGSFSSNLLIGRPYFLTFEILDKEDGSSKTALRVVPASELHAEALGSDNATSADTRDEPVDGGVEFDIVGEDGEVIMRSNRMTVDDPTRQTLSMEEIEELKKAGAGSGKDIIAKIMASHMAIDEKTSFSLAKYTLRKSKKYLKRFTVLPLDVGMLTEFVTEREAYKIMELREETLGLVCSWANIRSGESSRVLTAEDGTSQVGGGRWLVVDDTGGLVTAALAEKMGILYPSEEDDESSIEDEHDERLLIADAESERNGDIEMAEAPSEVSHELNPEHHTRENGEDTQQDATEDASRPADVEKDKASTESATTPSNEHQPSNPPARPRKPPRVHIPQMSALTNTLTIVHNNNQPNLAHLKYFSFDAGNPDVAHPLYRHLKSISWLQLLCPEEDPSFEEPEPIPDEVLATMKSSKRGNYFKKKRRFERTSRIVDETKRGGFDGLVVASVMEPSSVLKELVPLVRGGGRVVVYSANVEPLVELCDLYSKERRTAFMNRQFEASQNGRKRHDIEANGSVEEEEEDDFPVNPTLLLAPSLQTARARHWQVLPGRTHPMMTSKGGAEGYIFTGTKVIPAEGKVEARGNSRGKKRKTGADTAVKT